MENDLPALRKRLQRLSAGIIVGFLAVAALLVYWATIQASSITAREDNPRLVEAALRIKRGTILDAGGNVLAESVETPEGFVRFYATESVGPAVGYYSFRYGTSGVEAIYDLHLSGSEQEDWARYWNADILHKVPEGRDIKLTLISEWQRAADALLGEQAGAVLLVSLPEGAIRSAVSHPTYDPNQLDEMFEVLAQDENSPLLDRVTQGQYQPGMVLQPLFLAAFLDNGLLQLSDDIENADEPVQVDGSTIDCELVDAEDAQWLDVLQNQCPAPMQNLLDRVSSGDLAEIYRQFVLNDEETLNAVGEEPLSPVQRPDLALIGQDVLLTSPSALLRAYTSLANNGIIRNPFLVQAIENEEGVWEPVSRDDSNEAMISSRAVGQIYDALSRYEGIAEHASLAYSGPEKRGNSWYTGFAPADSPRYIVVVVVEDVTSVQEARKVGRSLLKHVLDSA